MPRFTCASVQATTSTISRARQTMVSVSEVSRSSSAQPTRSILVRVVTAEALQEVDEVDPGRRDRLLVARHLHEPGAAADRGKTRHHPALLLPVAREVVERDGPGLGVQRLARGGHGGLVERR